MKTMRFFILCLLLGVGLTEIAAQAPPNMPEGTKSVVWTFTAAWQQDISCGSYQDELNGSITFHETDLFKNGVMTRGENHGDGILTNSKGEKFVIHINFKGQYPYDSNYNYMNWTYHENIVGEDGAIYVGAASMTQDGVFTIEKAVCPDNGKK